MSSLFLIRGPQSEEKTTIVKALSKKIGAVRLDGDKLYAKSVFRGLLYGDINKAYAKQVSREAMRHIKKGSSVIIDRNMSLECTKTVFGYLENKKVPAEICDILDSDFFAQNQTHQQKFEKHPQAIFIDTPKTPLSDALKAIVEASDIEHPVHNFLLSDDSIHQDWSKLKAFEEAVETGEDLMKVE